MFLSAHALCCIATASVLFIIACTLQRLLLVHMWKVQWCYLCLILPCSFPLLLTSPPPSSLPFPPPPHLPSLLSLQSASPGSLHQLVQPLLTSCALLLVRKWWWDSKTTAETMQSRKRGRELDNRKELRGGLGGTQHVEESHQLCFFRLFYNLYVHPKGVQCLCVGLLFLCLALCCLYFIQCIFSPLLLESEVIKSISPFSFPFLLVRPFSLSCVTFYITAT